jgi:hypothetical protein
MKQLMVALAVTAFLSGCAALDMRRPVDREDMARVKRVGVVSAIGDTLYGVSVGTTVFGNSNFSAPIADWNLDASAMALAVEILKSNGRFEAAALDRAAYTGPQLMADHGKLVWDLAASQGFDTLVILFPSVSDNYRFFQPGVGIFERTFFGLTKRCLYAAYIAEVDEVATRKRIAWQWGGDSDAPCHFGSEERLIFRQKYDAYSDAEKQMLRQGIEARLSESLRMSLDKLKIASP